MKKRLLALTLAFAMVFSMGTTAFAAETISAQAKALNKLGLLDGDDGGLTAAYMSKQMDRLTAAIMVLKMQGVYAEALAYNGTDNFPDASKMMWPEGKKLLGYLKAHPVYGFSGMPSGDFEPYTKIDETSFLKVGLENLHYKMNIDFKWEEIKTFAAQKGVTVLNQSVFTVDGLAKITDSTLRATVKNANQSLANLLVKENKLNGQKAVEAGYIELDNSNLPLSVKNVTIPNLKQVEVTFNKPVDKVKAETVSNYTVKPVRSYTNANIAKAELLSDGKTVLLTISTQFTVGTQNNEVGVKKSVGIEKDYAVNNLTANDASIPTIVGVEMIGLREFDVIFSEPITITGSGLLTMDEGKIGINSVKIENYNRLKVLTRTDIKTGSHDLTFVNTDTKYIKDYAGFMFIPTTYTFDHQPDSTPLKAEITGTLATTQNLEVTIQFNRSITQNSLVFRLGEDHKKFESISSAKTTRPNEYKVIFNGLVPPGDITVFLTNKDEKNPAKDAFGNKWTNTAITGKIAVDNEKPTINSIAYQGEKSIEVVFSESLEPNSAQNKSAYVLRDPDGKKLEIQSSVYSDTTLRKMVTIMSKTEFTTGTYTLEVQGIRDRSIYSNEMDPVTLKFTCKDEKAPKVTAAIKLTDTIVKVVFSEPMASAAGKTNSWSVSGTTLEWVEMQEDQRTVLLHVKRASDITRLKCSLLMDLDDNALISGDAAYVNGFDVTIYIGTQTGIVADSISLVSAEQIDILVKGEEMMGADYDSFIVNKGSTKLEIGMVDTNYTESGSTIISIHLGYPLKQTTASGISVKLKDGVKITNPSEAILSLGSKQVEDKCGPTLVESSCRIVDYYGRMEGEDYGALRTLRLYFSESLYPASVSDEDIEVSGYAIDRISADGNTVTITLKDSESPFPPGDTVTVTIIGDVEDTSKNSAKDAYIQLTREEK